MVFIPDLFQRARPVRRHFLLLCKRDSPGDVGSWGRESGYIEEAGGVAFYLVIYCGC